MNESTESTPEDPYAWLDELEEQIADEQFQREFARAGCRCAIPNCTACPFG